MKAVVTKMTMKYPSETKPVNDASEVSNIAAKYYIFESFRSGKLF